MIKERLESILERIEKAKQRSNNKNVKLLAVSKSFEIEKIKEAYEIGQKYFGESKAKEFLQKYEALKDLDIKWDFIGQLQSNKVKYLIDKVNLIHSLYKESVLEEIKKKKDFKVNVLIEVNIAREPTKGGIFEEELKSFTQKVLSVENVRLLGLMCIPPFFEDKEKSRPYFAKLRSLKEELEKEFKIALSELSMGMSNDFEVAIEEGSTIVRVGTAIFGERV